MALLFCLLILWLPAGNVAAADIQSVWDLFNRIPAPPASAEEAATWFSKEGRLVHQGLLALKADIAANQKASALIARPAAEAQTVAPPSHSGEPTDVDVVRMQYDKLYAADIQSKLRAMTLPEQVALTQKLMQPQTPAHQENMRPAEDEPAVQAAAQTAEEFLQQQSVWATGPRLALGKEFIQAAQRADQKAIVLTKPTMEYYSAGCHEACEAQWNAYGDKLWPMVLARETELLQARRRILERYRHALAAMVKEAQPHLAASKYGAAAVSLPNRHAIASYHDALLGEIAGLVDLTESAAKRAAGIVNGGVKRWYGLR
jgi:hypothetical protein